MAESLYLTALLVGVFGGVHCLAMCGGVVSTLTFSVNPAIQTRPLRMFWYQLSYNFGRISSYALLGLVFGFLGSQFILLDDIGPFQTGLQLFSGVFMIALGLYLGGWWFGIVKIEQFGQGLWRKLQPFSQKLFPISSSRKSVFYGLFWGCLPCGLVYSMLIMAMSSGDAFSGAMVMLAFGLGTLPNLLLMGSFAFYFIRLSKNKRVKSVAGMAVIVMGLHQIYLAIF